MNEDETIAQQYMQALKPKQLLFEPEGKSKPPDFAMNLVSELQADIAVEVRRLNHNTRNSSHCYGIEEIQTPLIEKLKNLLKDAAPPDNGTWSLGLGWRTSPQHPKGPLSEWKRVKAFLNHCLQKARTEQVMTSLDFSFEDEPCELPATITSLVLSREASETNPGFFLRAEHSHDAQGWAAALLEHNLQVCLKDKNGKKHQYSSKYTQCWLILVDYVTRAVREDIKIDHDWDKVIILSPFDPSVHYEL